MSSSQAGSSTSYQPPRALQQQTGNSRFATHYVYNGGFPPEDFYSGRSGVDNLRDARFIDSITSYGSTTGDTNSTKSTIRMVNFREPVVSSVEDGSMISVSDRMQQSFQVEEVTIDEILLRHPRSLFFLACVKGVVGVQLLIFGTIGIIYGASPYYTVLWSSSLMLITSLIGLIFIRIRPKYHILLGYLIMCLITLSASMALFGLTAYWLTGEETQANKTMNSQLTLLQDTRIAMYSLQMVLAPIYAVCASITSVLLCLAYRDLREGRLSSAYFVSQSPGGHQNVLVPIDVRQVKELPSENAEAKMVTIGVQTQDRR